LESDNNPHIKPTGDDKNLNNNSTMEQLHCNETMLSEDEMMVDETEILCHELDICDLEDIKDELIDELENTELMEMDEQSFWENFCDGSWLD